MDYPITLEAFLTVQGVALFTGLVVQVLKKQLPDWRWTTIVAFVVGVAWAVLAQFLLAEWAPTGQAVFNTLMVGFFGAAEATFGYEMIMNARGLVGKGPRAEGVWAARR